MHFNAMLMQARSISISIVIAVFGGAALALSRAPENMIVLPGATVHLASVLMVFAVLLLFAVFVLDYFYYYRTRRRYASSRGRSALRHGAVAGIPALEIMPLAVLITANTTANKEGPACP